MKGMESIHIFPVRGLPEIRPGDDLAALLLKALAGQGLALLPGDVLVVAQKVVSKAEGSRVALAHVRPSRLARDWAGRWGRDPRLVEIVLRESRRIIRMASGVIISETRHGFVCANAGVDLSNSGDPDGELAILLPEDPDRSADELRAALSAVCPGLGVIIADSFGRPWRVGQTQVALGVAGLPALADYRGRPDAQGHTLAVTEIAVADQLACAADLVCGKTSGVPVTLIRGYLHPDGAAPPQAGEAGSGGHALIRQKEKDLFR